MQWLSPLTRFRYRGPRPRDHVAWREARAISAARDAQFRSAAVAAIGTHGEAWLVPALLSLGATGEEAAKWASYAETARIHHRDEPSRRLGWCWRQVEREREVAADA